MNEERKKWMDGWMDGSTNLHLCETKRHGAREREREREKTNKEIVGQETRCRQQEEG